MKSFWKNQLLFSVFLLLYACNNESLKKRSAEYSVENLLENQEAKVEPLNSLSLVVLGTVQDAGSPQIACQRECCKAFFSNPDASRKIVSLGIVDLFNEKKYLFEATPDFSSQLELLDRYSSFNLDDTPDGIFLTHAHIGHYIGLMYLGKEAMNANKAPVYAMPKMKEFLETNGPWSQLVKNENIKINAINDQVDLKMSDLLSIKPILVPHRDEFSETVGYIIDGPNKSALFIPDIDKWNKWSTSIETTLKEVDYAFLDATFYDGNEINNRDISEIPHPFVIESMQLFDNLPMSEKNKIHFIHFNHTNPLLQKGSAQANIVIETGYHIASINDVFEL